MDYTLAEDFTLPSHGKVYNKEVNPHVKLRSMTTQEEMRRLSISDRRYKILTDIIDDCLVEKPGISTYDMCLGDYEFLLHKLRIVTYGSNYKVESTCPYCGYTNHGTINLDDVSVIEYNKEIEKYKTFELPKSKNRITLKMQTPRMLDDISVKSKELMKKSSKNQGSAFLLNLQYMIAEVDGEEPDPIELEDFLKGLPMIDTQTITQYAGKFNDSIGVKADVETHCDLCGLDYNAPFRYTNEFFRPTII